MKINIKNMVCNRCILVVRQIFEQSGVQIRKVNLGSVETEEELSTIQMDSIEKELTKVGFEIIDDQISRLIEQIKNVSIEFVYKSNDLGKVNFSSHLSSKLNKGYGYLTSHFSSAEGITIEKYLIKLKIERVKELLVYGEENLSEIAWRMGYSSIAHLSGQFKKVTGLAPSYFKNLGEQKRKSLNDI